VPKERKCKGEKIVIFNGFLSKIPEISLNRNDNNVNIKQARTLCVSK